MATDTVNLDVGGKKYKTSSSTLLGQQSLFFETILNGQWAETREREIFIDRDGDTFQTVLRFLRASEMGKRAIVAHLTDQEKAFMREEAEFFQITSLAQLIDDAQSTAVGFISVRVPNHETVLPPVAVPGCGWKLTEATYIHDSESYCNCGWRVLMTKPA